MRRPSTKSPDSAFHFNLEPGQSREDGVLVKNTTSDTVQDLLIYIADAVPTSNGGIALEARQAPKSGLAKWIALDTSESISLVPGEERAIRFNLSVPMFSETKDERIAGIVVERAKAVRGRQDGQFIINILPRAAILITQRLPGPATRLLKITDFTQAWAPELGKEFKLAIENKGNIHLRPTAEINIYHFFGLKTRSIKINRPATIFPGTTSRLSAVWKDTPPIGFFTAEAVVRYEPDKSERRSLTFFIFPWWVVPLIVLSGWLIAGRLRQRWIKRRLKKLDSQDQATIAMQTLAKTVEMIEDKLPLAPVASATIKTNATAPEKSSERALMEAANETTVTPPVVEPAVKKVRAKAVGEKPSDQGKPRKTKTSAVEKNSTTAPKKVKKAPEETGAKPGAPEKKKPAPAKKTATGANKPAKAKSVKKPPADKA